MAYIGVACPVIARYEENNGNISYSNGFRFGKAIKIGIKPNYEDVSDYGGINDTEEEQEFAYADVTMNTSETHVEAETLMFGHIVNGDEIVSGIKDRGQYVGMGMRVTEVISGRRAYVAVWIHKIKFLDGEQEHETKGDSVDYKTPEIKGKAISDYNGAWRTKKGFQTKEEADEWLNQIAEI